MEKTTCSYLRILKYLIGMMVFTSVLSLGAIQGRAECEPDKSTKVEADPYIAQAIQTGLDYLKNIQDCDILGLTPHIDIKVDLEGSKTTCEDKSNEACGSNTPTPCGNKYEGKGTIGIEISGDIPTGPLGKTFAFKRNIFGIAFNFSGRLGITVQVAGEGSGSFSYTRNCDNSQCFAIGGSATGTITPGGGGTLTMQYKHAGRGNYKDHATFIDCSINGPISGAFEAQYGLGTCESGTNYVKFCHGPFQPYIQVALPLIGNWQFLSPQPWVDGNCDPS
jgi:hypothetical protein